MMNYHLTHEMKGQTVIVAIHEKNASMLTLHVSQNFSGCLCTELERRWTPHPHPGMCHLQRKRKNHLQRSLSISTLKSVQQVKNFLDAKPRTTMSAITSDFRVSQYTIRKFVEEDIRYKSYLMRKGQFMSTHTRTNTHTQKYNHCPEENYYRTEHVDIICFFIFRRKNILPASQSEPKK